jgi:uncharacterized protein
MKTRTLTVRGVPDPVLEALRQRAAARRRSLNGELLLLLEEAVESPHDAERAASRTMDEVPAAAPARTEMAVREPSRVNGRAVDLVETVDRTALAAVCRQHHLTWVAVFGSHARGEARPESDVDVVVEFERGRTPGWGIVRVAEALSPVFGGRRVDLVTRRGLAPRLRDRILDSAITLYGA